MASSLQKTTPQVTVTINPNSFTKSELDKSFAILQQRLTEYINTNPLTVDVKVVPEAGFKSTIEQVKAQMESIERDVLITVKNDSMLDSIKRADAALTDLQNKGAVAIKVDDSQLIQLAKEVGSKFNNAFSEGSNSGLKALNARLDEYQANLSETDSVLTNLENSQQKLKKKNDELSVSYHAIVESVKQSRSSAAAFNKEMSSTSTMINKVNKAIDKLGSEDNFADMSKTITNVEQILSRLVSTVKNYASENKNKLSLTFELDVAKTAKRITQQFNLLNSSIKEIVKADQSKMIKLVGTLDEKSTVAQIQNVIATSLGPSVQEALTKKLKVLDVTDGIVNAFTQNATQMKKQAEAAVKKIDSTTESKSKATGTDENTAATTIAAQANTIDTSLSSIIKRLDSLKTHWAEAFNDLTTIAPVDELQKFIVKLEAAKTLLQEISKLNEAPVAEHAASTSTGTDNTAKSGQNKGETAANVGISDMQPEIVEALNKAIDNINASGTLLNSIKLTFDTSDLKEEVNQIAKDLEQRVSNLSNAATLARGIDTGQENTGIDTEALDRNKKALEEAEKTASKYRKTIANINKTNKFEGYESASKEVKDVGVKLGELEDKIRELQALGDVELSVKGDDVNNVTKALNSLGKSFKNNAFDEKFANKAISELDQLSAKLQKMKIWTLDETFKIDGEQFGTQLNGQFNSIQDLIGKINSIKAQFNSSSEKIGSKGLGDDIKANIAAISEWVKKVQASRNYSAAWRKEVNKIQQAQASLNDYVDKYGSRLKRFPALWKQIQQIQEQLTSQNIDSSSAQKAIDEVMMSARALGVETENLFTKIWERVGFNFRSMAASTGLMYIQSAFRGIYENVKNLDAAMTELRKVTDETESTYIKFLDNASERAQKLGASLVDVVSSTSDFARLGYNISEATELSDAATIYLNVGDDVESIDDATKSIISTMQGFGIETKDVMDIVNKFNEVANRMPTSAGDIGEGLLRSASALSAAGNTLDESIALFTAGQGVVQDAESLGTVLKTNIDCLYVQKCA